MNDELNISYKRAKTVSRMGAYLLYAFSLLSLSVPLVFLYAFTQTDVMDSFGAAWQLWTLIGQLAIAVATFFLGTFLRHFGKDVSPFGNHQATRLLAAAGLLALRVGIDAFLPTVPYNVSITSDVSISSTIGIDFKMVVVVVFLLCLSMVIRYGDALKKDSDSIA